MDLLQGALKRGSMSSYLTRYLKSQDETFTPTMLTLVIFDFILLSIFSNTYRQSKEGEEL